MGINLKRLLAKPELQGIIQQLIGDLETTLTIQDTQGKFLLGNDCGQALTKHPILIQQASIGWVLGDKKAASIAALLS